MRRGIGESYPGIGNRLIVCDVCGGEFRVRDTVQVRNRYSPQNNMIVCKKDVDIVNPQAIPFKLPKDDSLTDKYYVRPRTPLDYVPNTASNQSLPSKPRNLVAQLDDLTSGIQLTWDGPDSVGSNPIIGYSVTRAEPEYAFQFSLISNTNTPATYFLDTTIDLTSSYTYQVAAISSLGTGPYSDIAVWPTQLVALETIYITDGNNVTITDGDGNSLIDAN